MYHDLLRSYLEGLDRAVFASMIHRYANRGCRLLRDSCFLELVERETTALAYLHIVLFRRAMHNRSEWSINWTGSNSQCLIKNAKDPERSTDELSTHTAMYTP